MSGAREVAIPLVAKTKGSQEVHQQPKRVDFWAAIPNGEGAGRRKELREDMDRLVVRPLTEEMKRARRRVARARLFPVG